MSESFDPADCLHGWKAIAGFLGRSTRAVQRWETELDLPIRRIRTERGQTVFALKSELTQWLGGVNHAKLNEVESAAPRSIPPRFSLNALQRGVVLISVVVVLIAGAAIPFVRGSGDGATRKIERVEIQGQTLEGRDASGETVWSFDLGRAGGRLVSSRDSMYRPNPLLSDLDGDGTEEVIVAMHFGTHERDLGEGHQLYCFSAQGDLKWRYLPKLSFKFRDQTFDGASRFLGWMADGKGAVWISVNHHTWWPTAIVRIDPRGEATVRYVHAGGIYAMTSWNLGNKTYLALGGINNEYQKAALTLLDVDSSPASSPQSLGSAYECLECPPGKPSAFYLFERTDLSESTGDPYSRVSSVSVVGDRLKVMTEEAKNAAVVHVIDGQLQVVESSVNDAFTVVHDEASARGVLNHSPANCPTRERVKKVGIWTKAGGWTEGSLVSASPR